MNIFRDQKVNLVSRSKSKFPKVSNKILDRIWTDRRGKSGQDILEYALNLIGKYEFDKNYLREINENTFELKTTSGKKIIVSVSCGNPDDFPQITVTEDNIETAYNYVPVSGNSNLLYFDTDKQTDLETGFVQYYVGYCDQVLMSKDGITTMVSFYNPNPLGSYEKDNKSQFLVSDKLKNATKKAISKDIVELYNAIVENLGDVKTFEIHIYDSKSYKTLDKIIVSNRTISYILLTRKYGSGSVTLEEDHRKGNKFSAHIDNVYINYDEALDEFESLERALGRRLKR